MAKTTVSIKMDSDDKKAFEEFCDRAGLNISVAINMYVKNVLYKGKIPFEVEADPFYNPKNQRVLQESIKQLNEGKGKLHDIIEVDE